MKPIILLDRHYGISQEEAVWFSSISPFNSRISVLCAVPEKRSREAFLKASEEFWKTLDNYKEEEILLFSTGLSSRVIHPDFIASTWMLYHIIKDGKLIRLISLPTSFSFLSKEGLSLFSASQIREFSKNILEREKEFKKLEILKKDGIEIYNLGDLPEIKITPLNEDTIEKIYDLKGEVVLDLETSGLRFYKDRIFLVSLYQKDEVFVFLFKEEFKKILRDWIKKCLKSIVGAHIKFDALFLAWNLGNLEDLLEKEWLDPLLMVLMLDNSMVRDRGLKSLAARFFYAADYGTYFLSGEESEDPKTRWSKIHSFFSSLSSDNREVLNKVLAYTAMDVYWTLRLEKFLSEQLDKDLWVLYKKLMEEPSKLLAEISYRGLKIDWDLVRERNKLAEEELSILKKKIFEETGITNPDSLKQIREFLLENYKLQLPKTKTGNPKVSFEVLSSIEDPKIELIVNYRLLRHLNSNFLKEESLKENSSGERIHPDFNQGTVMTGRLSSSSPNLQQLPGKRTDIKSRGLSETYKKVWNVREFIIPDSDEKEKHKILEIDLNQAELRGGAFICQERRMLYGFRTGEDLYRLIGEKIYNKPKDQITKEERIPLKTLLLGIMYGMTVSGICKIFNCSRKIGKEILDQTFSFFPQIKKLSDNVRHFLSQDSDDILYIAPTRQRRILEKCGWKVSNQKWFEKKIFRECFTSAVNFPVQSMTSDWVLRLAFRLRKDFKEVKILNLVHDSVLLDVPERLVPSVLEKFSEEYRSYLLDDEILEVMIKRLLKSFPLEFPVIDIPPIRYEAKIGDSWGSASEIPVSYKIEILPDWTDEVLLMVPVKKSDKDRKLLNFILIRETGVLLEEKIYKEIPETGVLKVKKNYKIDFIEGPYAEKKI